MRKVTKKIGALYLVLNLRSQNFDLAPHMFNPNMTGLKGLPVLRLALTKY